MSAEVAVVEGTEGLSRFEASLQAEQAAERDLLASIAKAILVSLPISIAVFLLISAIAVSSQEEWYVWIGLGVGIGVVGAILMGGLAGATLNAHKLDEVDHDTYT